MEQQYQVWLILYLCTVVSVCGQAQVSAAFPAGSLTRPALPSREPR